MNCDDPVIAAGDPLGMRGEAGTDTGWTGWTADYRTAGRVRRVLDHCRMRDDPSMRLKLDVNTTIFKLACLPSLLNNVEENYQIMRITGVISVDIFSVEDELSIYRMHDAFWRGRDAKTDCQLHVYYSSNREFPSRALAPNQ